MRVIFQQPVWSFLTISNLCQNYHVHKKHVKVISFKKHDYGLTQFLFLFTFFYCFPGDRYWLFGHIFLSFYMFTVYFLLPYWYFLFVSKIKSFFPILWLFLSMSWVSLALGWTSIWMISVLQQPSLWRLILVVNMTSSGIFWNSRCWAQLWRIFLIRLFETETTTLNLRHTFLWPST